MKIMTSNTNLDMKTDLDNLHPIRQIEECEKQKNNDITIVTYSTYIIEWATINKIEVIGCSIQEAYDSLNSVFDTLDEMSIHNFIGGDTQ